MVRADSSVRAKPQEHTLRRAIGDRVEVLDNREGKVRDVVVDADLENGHWILQQVVEDRHRHRRRELLRPKAVLAANADERDLRVEERRRGAAAPERARLLRLVKNGDPLDSLRERSEDVPRAPWRCRWTAMTPTFSLFLSM